MGYQVRSLLVILLGVASGLQAQTDNQPNPSASASATGTTYVAENQMLGAAVLNAEGTKIATVSDLVVNLCSGRTIYTLLDTGSGDPRQISYIELEWAAQEGHFELDYTKEQLDQLPVFKMSDLEDAEFTPVSLRTGSGHVSSATGMSSRAPMHGASDRRMSGSGDSYAWLISAQQPEVIVGTIAEIRHDVRTAGGETVCAVMVDTKGKRTAVLLAPQATLSARQVTLQPGQSVTLTTYRVLDGDGAEAYLASKIQPQGGSVIELRDQSGQPVQTAGAGNVQGPSQPAPSKHSYEPPQTSGTGGAGHSSAPAPQWDSSVVCVNGLLSNTAATETLPIYVLASTLNDRSVVTSAGQEVGKMSELVVEASTGDVVFGIVKSGGLFGIGATEQPVPCGALTLKDRHTYSVNLSAEEMKEAPGLPSEGVAALDDSGYAQEIFAFYKQSPRALESRESLKAQQKDTMKSQPIDPKGRPYPEPKRGPNGTDK